MVKSASVQKGGSWFDVYSLDTESEIVYVFVPIDLLTLDRGDRPGIVVQEAGEEEYTSAFFTDDGKYVGFGECVERRNLMNPNKFYNETEK